MDLPVVVVSAECAVLRAAAVTETNAPAAYCARVDAQSDATVWSLEPENLRTATTQPSPTPRELIQPSAGARPEPPDADHPGRKERNGRTGPASPSKMS